MSRLEEASAASAVFWHRPRCGGCLDETPAGWVAAGLLQQLVDQVAFPFQVTAAAAESLLGLP